MSEDVKCRWVGSDKPRIVVNRHDYGCNDETCRGCQPCTEAHCRVCGMTHHAGACPTCVGAMRESLDEILRMTRALPDEVLHRGVDGEAMVLLGPVADPEARGHRQASAAVGRAWVDEADHERHPLTVLGTWAMVVEDAREDQRDGRLTVWDAADYLDRHLTWIGGCEYVEVADLARDLRQSVAHMERVLHDGEQIEKGAPCPQCGRNLLHEYGTRVTDDVWRCPARSCGIVYTTREYRGWVEEDARNEADRLTAEDMSLRFTTKDFHLKASVVRVWGARDLIRKRGRNDRGMTLYDVADVEARLAATRTAESA